MSRVQGIIIMSILGVILNVIFVSGVVIIATVFSTVIRFCFLRRPIAKQRKYY